jgi:hypothetical protein
MTTKRFIWEIKFPFTPVVLHVPVVPEKRAFYTAMCCRFLVCFSINKNRNTIFANQFSNYQGHKPLNQAEKSICNLV